MQAQSITLSPIMNILPLVINRLINNCKCLGQVCGVVLVVLSVFIAAWLTFHFPATLNAEPFVIRKRLTRSDGLPSNTVRHILRDRQGIFWILTAKGVCRYDGQRIYPFSFPSDSNPEKNLLPLEQSLSSCAEDSSRAMWFGTKSGLIRFLPRTGMWKRYHQMREENKALDYIDRLHCDRSGIMWIGTRGGLLRYDKTKDSCLLAFPQLANESIQTICENSNGTLWFSTFGNTLSAFLPKTNKLITGIPLGCENGYYLHTLPHRDGVWISPLAGANQAMQAPRLVTLDTSKGIFIFSASALSVSSELLHGIDFYPHGEDELGAWYVRVNDYAAGRCESGLYRIAPRHLSVHSSPLQFPSSKIDSILFREQIIKGNITAFSRDPRTGIVCIGASEQGVTILIPTGIERLSDSKRISDAISIYTDKRGRIWCGTRKGLFLQREGVFEQVKQESEEQSLGNKTAASRVLPIYDIKETVTGTILAASSEGLLWYDESRNTLRLLKALVAAIGKSAIRKICPDPFSNDIWLAASSIGLLHCNEDGGLKEYFEHGQSQSSLGRVTLGISSILSMQFDNRGNLWVGGIGAILRWNRQVAKIERFTTLPTTTQSLLPIKFVISARQDNLIFGLNGIGLASINTQIPVLKDSIIAQYIHTLPINSRLGDVQVVGVAEADNALWWTTYTNGVYRAKRTRDKNGKDTNNSANIFSLITPELLLPSDENAIKGNFSEQSMTESDRGFNIGALTSDGKGGVLFDYYGDVLQANHTARVFTDTARVVPIGYFRNDSVMAGLPQHGDTLYCAYGGSFALSCAVVSLARPERHCLEYRLEGVDADWNIMPDASLRTVRYSSLQPGEYRLLVRTRTQDPHDEQPLLSANTLAFTVYVPYPWWMHPITRTLGFLTMAVGFVWVGYTVQQRRVHQRLERLEREKEFENVKRLASEAQMQTLRLQMNPHFLYNVLAEIQMLVESGNEMASYYIAVFSRLLDRVLRKAVNNFISVSDEIHILKKYIELEELRNAGHLKCYVMLTPDAEHVADAEYDDDESDESDTEYWRSREMPTFILQPFVENAIRHGIRGLAEEDWKTRPSGGIITIHLFEEGDSLRCVVTDNGIGREEAARRKAARPQGAHLSIATSVTHERLELLEKAFGVHLSIRYNDLYDETGAAAGTEVTVVMPLRAVQA